MASNTTPANSRPAKSYCSQLLCLPRMHIDEEQMPPSRGSRQKRAKPKCSLRKVLTRAVTRRINDTKYDRDSKISGHCDHRIDNFTENRYASVSLWSMQYFMLLSILEHTSRQCTLPTCRGWHTNASEHSQLTKPHDKAPVSEVSCFCRMTFVYFVPAQLRIPLVDRVVNWWPQARCPLEKQIGQQL